MTLRRRVLQGWSRAVHLGALAAVVLALIHALLNLERVSSLDLWLLLVYAVTIVVGELWRVSVLSTRDFPPISLAASLALPMTAMVPDDVSLTMPASVVVITVAGATFIGHLLRRRLLAVEQFGMDEIAIRVLVVGLAAMLYRELPLEGRPLTEWTADWHDMKWLTALTMVAVALIAMGAQVLLMALRYATQRHAMLWQSLVDEAGAVGPLALATTSTAAVIALAVAALGPIAVPLFMAPLLLQLAVSRQSVVRATQRQTVRSLSRLTEQGGFTTQGHSARVAARATEIGRDLGLPERDLVDLEYAALLHDLGQVSLPRPIPGGATTATSPLDQRRIAHTGAAILARTTDLSRLSVVVAGQATPYKMAQVQSLPLQSRILRVANAYDDLVGTATGRTSIRRALERIRLGLDYEYDPLVVRSLCRVLQREGSISPVDVSRLEL